MRGNLQQAEEHDDDFAAFASTGMAITQEQLHNAYMIGTMDDRLNLTGNPGNAEETAF